jgi:N-dimethylarginine dimethylaminohydrolase
MRGMEHAAPGTEDEASTGSQPAGWGGHSMAAPLRRVLVASPEAAGWSDPGRTGSWRELGFLHPLDPEAGEASHRALVAVLEAAGAEVVTLTAAPDLSLDAVYAHDASLVTDRGAILLRMGKPSRAAEPDRHGELYRRQGIPVLGRLEPPATAEAGDLVWLDDRTLLAGRSYRTNAAGIEQLRGLLAPLGVAVVEAPLPHGGGPELCLHLMSLVSVLDERTVLVDTPWLAVSTLEELDRHGFERIEIVAAERELLAANVLALGNRRLLALAECPATAARLRDHGFEVATVPGAELGINGSGGPTCLTRPLLRLNSI